MIVINHVDMVVGWLWENRRDIFWEGREYLYTMVTDMTFIHGNVKEMNQDEDSPNECG